MCELQYKRGALPEMNQACITSCLPRFVKIGMGFPICDLVTLRGSNSGRSEKCPTSLSHVHPPSAHRSRSTNVMHRHGGFSKPNFVTNSKMNRISGGRKHHHTHGRRKGDSFAVRKGITAAPSPKNNVNAAHPKRRRRRHDSLSTNAFWLFLSQILRSELFHTSSFPGIWEHLFVEGKDHHLFYLSILVQQLDVDVNELPQRRHHLSLAPPP